MAESQLTCMEDGHIGAKVPESKPEFYYSEEQRAAVEELLKNGDGAFKTRLEGDHMKDFLSAREVKLVVSSFQQYDLHGEPPGPDAQPDGTDADSGVHSTYWPQMSDTEVPPLDIGWPGGGFFRGVTRVAVHTHPPKENGPHIKEVVRRLIQEASKVIAIVMDMLTDVQILQDLMDAASRRSVPVYILLDLKGVPHFLDICSRLQIGSQHLRNIRTRTLEGTGFGLSFGRLPGSLCNKYMLVDGDKVVFGSYSFSWCTSRMDRNMITVMTGQVVDSFDSDFRELYAVSEKLDLYKEFHVGPPAANAPTRARVGTVRPPLPATTSRFQVSLGDSRKAAIQVPAHKYYNPKYSLAYGDVPRPPGSLQDPGPTRAAALAEVPEEMDPGRPRVTSSLKQDRMSPLPSEDPSKSFKKPNRVTLDKKGRAGWMERFSKRKQSSKDILDSLEGSSAFPSPRETDRTEENQDDFEVVVKSPSRWKIKNPTKLGQRTNSEQTVNTAQDPEGVKGRRQAKECSVS
ncbi:protein FAM83F-like [Cyclopterus lumpus]|uniref:Family with sequence similarity 83 member Fb n=1 Tax=Cyclopterus lumpus TaxID=8103 RepID=A0A8C2XSL2_CYCLU|nr:protein FAM83F-like [Cyclopterus lumpus]